MQTKEHPDDLTPREREVFGLLRLGLTNEEIAERLGISLDGAKYHVSQILSKLGVATREEAAAVAIHAPTTHVAEAFQPRRSRWWAALPLAARAAGAAVVVAAVGGLGVLAWGVLRTAEGDVEADPGVMREAAESDLPDMVLQPEDVPANMKRLDSQEAGLGFQREGEIGEVVSYQVEYELGPDEADPGEIACIQSVVALFGTAEEASRGFKQLSETLRTEAGDLAREIGVPGIGDEAVGFAVTSPEAVFCSSYENEAMEQHLIAFRISNTTSVLGVVFLDGEADLEQSVQYAQRQERRIDAVLALTGPRIGDHWHAPYMFTACGVRQPNAPVWEGGVHTHGDGIIHIHPFQTFEEGAGASLVKWFEYGGGLLTDTEINIPGSAETFRNGDLCPDGKPGELQVLVTRAGESAEERLTGDALQQYIPHDGDRVRIVFGPPEEPIVHMPKPEEAEPTPPATP